MGHPTQPHKRSTCMLRHHLRIIRKSTQQLNEPKRRLLYRFPRRRQLRRSLRFIQLPLDRLLPSQPRIRTRRHAQDNTPRACMRHSCRKPLPSRANTPSMGRLPVENPRHTPTPQSNHTSTPPCQPAQIHPITQTTRQGSKPLHP